jgi:hypothetical protein
MSTQIMVFEFNNRGCIGQVPKNLTRNLSSKFCFYWMAGKLSLFCPFSFTNPSSELSARPLPSVTRREGLGRGRLALGGAPTRPAPHVAPEPPSLCALGGLLPPESQEQRTLTTERQ